MATVLKRLAVLRKVPPQHFELPPLHMHVWTRFPGSVGIFHCCDHSCLWCAVCPGCLGSIEVALQVRDSLPGLVLCWCSQHSSRVEVEDALSA
jgi:hypothetical protein